MAEGRASAGLGRRCLACEWHATPRISQPRKAIVPNTVHITCRTVQMTRHIAAAADVALPELPKMENFQWEEMKLPDLTGMTINSEPENCLHEV
jgi:hypothetical protein